MNLTIAAVSAVATACAPVKQPESNRQVAAVEVMLRTQADRDDLLAMLRRHAHEGGLHIDDVSARWAQFRKSPPQNEPASATDVLTKTIYVGLWRGAEDDDPEVIVDDGGHQGRPWLIFLKGRHAEQATQVRVELLADIKRRWPDARDIPVTSSGALPLERDLVWTGNAYVVTPARLNAYARRGD